MDLAAVLTPAEEGGYVAFNPETGTTTEGESIEEVIANLREGASARYGGHLVMRSGSRGCVVPLRKPDKMGTLACGDRTAPDLRRAT